MAELLQYFPWAILLYVFSGMLALCWKISSGQHDQSTLLTEALARLSVPPSPPAPRLPLPVAPAPLPPRPLPKPAVPLDDYPVWYKLGLHDIGFHEIGNNQGIETFIAQAHCGSPGDAWCAIWANAKLEQAGITGTRSPSSQSFKAHSSFVQLAGPAKGAIVVFWRISKASGQGHVGFYRGEDATRIWTLGGNENDMVQIEALPKDSDTFGLIGYWWPKSVPLPPIGAVPMPAASPVHVQTPPDSVPAATAPGDLQKNIIATVFGGQQSAYGPPIDDNSPGVALPFRFTGERPEVHVINQSNGVSVICNIVDIGPWNINDPYWMTGTRPQAESGTDLGQVGVPRHTNKAGIDLTAAAAKALQIEGKGLVSWQFVTGPLASPPIPTVT